MKSPSTAPLRRLPRGLDAWVIQAQWIETNWGYYRGQHNSDGSLFVQRARPPARPAQACRDTVGPVGDIFYNTHVLGTAAAGTPFPGEADQHALR